MYKLNELFALLDEYAPIRLSEAMIKNGEYDNSGIIVNHHEDVKKVLFSLDLSERAVKTAKAKGCDTVVTHHPAIYYPIKKLSAFDETTSPVLCAAASKLNVISMHLNLDVAESGIDACLSKALGGEKYKILLPVEEGYGYGREFPVGGIKLSDFTAKIKKTLRTVKVLCYGKPSDTVKKVASFCGGGSSFSLDAVKNGITDADLIVTSDMPHHVIRELVEYGKKVILLPHYVAEEYGFSKFYEYVSGKTKDKLEIYYLDDKRFR